MDIALQIDGKWAVLPDDTEISVEENSPIFGEGNTYSFPFELNIEENRHIIGNSDQISGESLYKVLDKKDAVLYAGGIPFFYGIISLDDEIEVNDGYIEISLISSTLAFDDMFQDMNCRDVPLKDDIMLGYSIDELDFQAYYQSDGSPDEDAKGTIYLPESFVFPYIPSGGEELTNVSDPYPSKKYCNIRICYKSPDSEGVEGENFDFVTGVIGKVDKGGMFSLDANRNQSAPCFYLMYFLECLFANKEIQFRTQSIPQDSDINRIAFINTKCCVERRIPFLTPESGNLSYNTANTTSFNGDLSPRVTTVFNAVNHGPMFYRQSFIGYYVYATSENFPDTDVKTVLDVFCNMLKAKFIYNARTKEVGVCIIKDILNAGSLEYFRGEILSVSKRENPISGYKLTYNGDEDNTSYNYNDWDGAIEITSYNQMLKKISAFNKNLYIDKRNGNAYRVKIDGEATSTENAHASWFEVGEYIPVMYGDCSDENRTEICELGFNPLYVNDVSGSSRLDTLNGKDYVDDISDNDQSFAVYIDVEMEYPLPSKFQEAYTASYRYADTYFELKLHVSFFDIQRYNYQISSKRVVGDYGRYGGFESRETENNYPTVDEGSPIQKADLGLTLGIMRGPGNQSGREDYEKDYDDEGNEKYRIVPKNYAMHSDSVDNYARVFDYNGTGEGGVDVTNRFSLKLKAEKPIATGSKEYRQCSLPECAERGLFDKFHKEYAHFVTNRKIAILELRMELADLINIDWKSRYTIGGITGFVNKYSYSISNRGISTVTMELYYL